MKNHIARLTTTLIVLLSTTAVLSADTPATDDVKVISDIAYKAGDLSDYEKERCKLDLYLPAGKKDFATVVYFHGGGLKEGDRTEKGTVAWARSFAQAGLGVTCANYRFSPKVKYPAYNEDAAAAFAWTHKHIADHGGDPRKVFIAGHSAGGYLALIIGLDERLLKACGLDLSAIAGAIPISGQTITHTTIREERGLSKFTVTADEAAPVYYGRKQTPPMLLLYGDHDMAARAEENAYFVAVMKGAGNKKILGLQIQDRDHVSIMRNMVNPDDPARVAMLKFIENTTTEAKTAVEQK